jgi:hypothetical protein
MKITAKLFKEYAELVHETREAQKLYFAVRSTFNLDRAKSLEKRLDLNTQKIKEELSKIEQNQLPLPLF